jgi:hypothetical protein
VGILNWGFGNVKYMFLYPALSFFVLTNQYGRHGKLTHEQFVEILRCSVSKAVFKILA